MISSNQFYVRSGTLIAGTWQLRLCRRWRIKSSLLSQKFTRKPGDSTYPRYGLGVSHDSCGGAIKFRYIRFGRKVKRNPMEAKQMTGSLRKITKKQLKALPEN